MFQKICVPFLHVDININLPTCNGIWACTLESHFIYIFIFLCIYYLCVYATTYIYISMLYAVDAILLHEKKTTYHTIHYTTFYRVHTISNDIVFIIFIVVVFLTHYIHNFFHLSGDDIKGRKRQVNACKRLAIFVRLHCFFLSSSTMLLCHLTVNVFFCLKQVQHECVNAISWNRHTHVRKKHKVLNLFSQLIFILVD